MNHPILHILKKDFYRTRLASAALGVILLGKALLVLLVMLDHPAFGFPYPILINGMYLYQLEGLHSRTNEFLLEPILTVFLYSDLLCLALLVAWVTIQDTPLGEKSFWRARPVSGVQMFATKAIFICIVTWPMQVVVQIATSAALGWFSYHQQIVALFYMCLIQALVVATVVICVVLWRNVLAGFAVLLVLFIAYCLIPNYVHDYRYTTTQSEFLVVDLPILLWFLLAIILAWWMYVRRNRKIGFVIFTVRLAVLYLYQYCNAITD
jgi:hypothetical protein